MLHIDLVRETPEALKPRRIEITRADKTQSQALDAQRNLTNLPELTET
jgi:molecular chaperone IbpA